MNGRVKPRVFVDGRVVFEGPAMSSLDPPIDIIVPVSGSKLSLVVLKTADGDYNDHCEWLKPILTKKQHTSPNNN